MLVLKRCEKVDYAIFVNNKPVILIECKHIAVNLEKEQVSQLFRYFGTQTGARFGVLTNGVQYRFYCDLNEQNKMDEMTFF
jgi:hypothetical protein